MKNKIFWFGFIFWVVFSCTVVEGQNLKERSLDEDQCFICHKEMEILPEGFSELDVHMKAGLSCVGCHGGDASNDDMEIAMSPAKGFVGIPKRDEIPQFCGKCHSKIEIMRSYQPRIATDQLSQYYTSVHGMKLRQGDKNVAECVSCHTAHSIFYSNDPRSAVYALNVPSTCNNCHGNKELMAKYGLKGNELSEYSKSVHGVALLENKDIGAPACNDCHGNHGATPPGISSISHVCGICHINNEQYFKESSMSAVFEEMDYHGCEQCHGNHLIRKPTDGMVGMGEESLCTACHSEGDPGYEAGFKMNNFITQLVSSYDSAQVKLADVQNKGMNDADIILLLQEAKQNLIQSRTLVHKFDQQQIKEKTGEGLNKVNDAIKLADIEIDEYYTRRNGFALATGVFIILVVALYFKLKDMSKNRKNKRV